jgi:hypothetical protein
MIDPSGGWSALANGLAKGLEMTRLGVAALTTFAGALIGNAAYGASGGQGAKGLIIGAFAGLASNFSGSIGGAAVQAIVGVGNQVIQVELEKAMPTVAPPQATISNTGTTNTGTTVSGAMNTSNNEQKNTSPRVFPFPVLEAITPETYKLNIKAINVDKKPSLLTYHGDAMLKKQKRNEVCPTSNNPRPSGQSCQEYPFACTEEGGITKAGWATTGLVPIDEQWFEGAGISILITVFGMKPGDKILVIPIAEKYTPMRQPATKDEKRIKWYEIGAGIFENILNKFSPKIPIIPELIPQRWNPSIEL